MENYHVKLAHPMGEIRVFHSVGPTWRDHAALTILAANLSNSNRGDHEAVEKAVELADALIGALTNKGETK